MAWRIEENVVRGEIDNRTFGRVHGKVWLTGRDNPLVLELTGNCHKDLAGCRPIFTNPVPKSDSQTTLVANHGAPKDEFEWDTLLRASERSATKLGELMEKYLDDPERDRLIAREMGWTWIEEMLAAEAERSGEREPDDTGFEESEPAEMEEEPSRHPLVARLINRSATLVKLAGDRRDNDLEEMIGGFMAVCPTISTAHPIATPH